MSQPFYKVGTFGGCPCARVLTKARRRKRRVVGSPDYLAWLEDTLPTLKTPLLKFLKEERAKMATLLVKELDLGKAASADDIKRVVDALDFSKWTRLIGILEEPLTEAFKANAKAGFELIGFTPDESIVDLVNEEAVDYAKVRAGELVGMRRNKDGEWVQNPNAKYAITETTREDVRSMVEDAVAEGWSADTFADELESSFAFSAERASTIARTELAFAHSEGNMAAWQASGEVEGKQWILGSEHDMDDQCNDNADAGVIDFYDAFPSGHTAAPAHPNCVCDVLPVLREAK